MKKCLIFLVFSSILNTAKSQYSVSSYAGTGIAGLKNGDLSIAQFKQPFGICKDKFGNIFIADQGNNCIRKISPDGMVSTYAGTGIGGYMDGKVNMALFNQPAGVCADDSGNIYVADFNNQRIRKINTSGMVSTIAGSGFAGYSDGKGLSAEFNYPRGICVDKDYNLYIGDSWNHRVRKITPNGNVTTYAGGGKTTGVQSVGAYVDATDTSARFYTPCGLSVDALGNVFVADAYNHRIRKIDKSRNVSTIVGSGPTGSGQGGYLDGNVSSARLNTPTEVFIDSSGNFYIGDTFGNRIRKLSSNNGMVSCIGGDGTAGFLNGLDCSAKFSTPRGLVAFSNGKVYVSDFTNNRIRLLSPNTTDIGEYLEENSINIYPNPASNLIIIENKGRTKECSMIILNIKGQECWRQNLAKHQTEINISDLPGGIYFVKLISDSVVETRKIVKE